MTFDYETELADANIGLLDSELRAVFGAAISGLSYSDPNVTVHFLNEPSANDLLLAAATIASHNPVGLTPAQELAAMTEQAKADTFLSELRHKTPAQVEAWILAEVDTLQKAREILAKMGRVIAYLMLHAELRGD